MASLKRRKEEFVSNLNGTSLEEVDLILVSQSAFFLTFGLCFYWIFFHCRNQPGLPPLRSYSCRLFLLEFLCLVIPVLLILTVASHKLALSFVVTLFTSLLLVIFMIKSGSTTRSSSTVRESNFGKKSSNSPGAQLLTMRDQTQFLTVYRAFVNVTTAICILGVDLSVFPRRFGKVETYGTGLMDLPVGCFILCNSVVCSEARRPTHNFSFLERLQALSKTAQSSAPLVILGVLRLITIKGVGYQEHVSEYGVHWNFFFTLASVKIICTMLFVVIPTTWAGCVSVILCAVYEGALELRGLRQYIVMDGGRDPGIDGFLMANREGVCSVLGFCALYMAGVQLGQYIFSNSRRTSSEWVSCFLVLLTVSCGFYISCRWYDSRLTRVSRRLANLPYLLWMMHCNLLSITMFLGVYLGFDFLEKSMNFKGLSEISSQILNGATGNGLFFFLLANLFTGFINMCVDTMAVDSPQALLILSLYMGVLCFTTYTLHIRGISTKFW